MGESPGRRPPTSASIAFSSIVQQAQGTLYGFVRGLVASDEQARDIVQDVFVDAWRLVRQGDPPFTAAALAQRGTNEQGIRRWLFHVAYRTAISAVRRDRLIRWHSLDATDATVIPESRRFFAPRPFEDQVVEAQVLRTALLDLTSEDAACILLNVVQGFTAHEIAQIVGITPEAAKRRVSRAKQRLRAAYFAQHAQTEEGA